MACASMASACFHLLVMTSCLITMAVGQDNVPPTISCPSDRTGNTNSGVSTETVTWTVPVGDDNVGIEPTSRQCNPTSGSAFEIGINTVTCSVRDTSGNEVSCTFRVTISDNEAPVVNKCPVAVRKTIPDFDPLLPVDPVAVTWDKPVVTDNSAGSTGFDQPSPTHEPGSEFPLGVTQVVYTARDNSGNTNNECSFGVYVAVQPTENHTFTESVTGTGFTVVWPELEDESIAEYYILPYRDGNEPDIGLKIFIAPDNIKEHTYIREEVGNLSPGELYTIEVGTVSGEEISTIQQWTSPSQPGNVVLVSTSPSSVEVSWTLVNSEKVEQYRVHLYSVISGSRDLGYVTNTTNRIVAVGIYPGIQQHAASVRAVVGSGDMRLESASLLVVEAGVPINGSQLIAYNYTESTIEVAWLASSETSNDNEPYMLFIDTEGEEQPEVNYLTVFNQVIPAMALFEGLKPNTEYHIKLISNLGLSLSTTQTTRPERVLNIRPTVVLVDSVTLEWDPPTEGDIVYSYKVYISPSPGKTYDPEITSTGTSKVLSSLTNGTEYFFKIVSVYGDVESVPQTLMMTIGVTKAVDSSPLNVEALAVGAVLGVFVLVLVIVLLTTCLKYRKSKGTSGGHATNAVVEEDSRRYVSRNVDSGDLYEDPDAESMPKPLNKPSPPYQNTIIGPAVKTKSRFGRRR